MIVASCQEALLIRERDPFGRAITILRARLASGAFAEGEPLIIVDLARELDLSPTPVREALQRLAGEGLVEERRGRGYFSWRIDVADLAELYDLSSLLVGAAVGTLEARGPSDGRDLIRGLEVGDKVRPEDIVMASERLFGRLIRSAGNRAMIGCYIGVASRLGPARRLEHHVLTDLGPELSLLVQQAHDGAWKALSAAVAAYYERRRIQAPALVVAARSET